jgi:hypothetical protein
MQAIEVLTRGSDRVAGPSGVERRQARVVVSKWDSLYNRIIAIEFASA